jgi:hemoglobin-like flavoprotein
MTPGEKEIVERTWRKILPIADTAADIFYRQLFDIDPDVRALFGNVDLAAQKKKLLQALATAVAGLNCLDVLAPHLAELGRRHAEYGVIDRHYETVGCALLQTLQEGLGADWTADAELAWTAAYTLVAETMKAGAPSELAQIGAHTSKTA